MTYNGITMEYSEPTVRETKSRRRALAESDGRSLAQVERRRSQRVRDRALLASGMRVR